MLRAELAGGTRAEGVTPSPGAGVFAVDLPWPEPIWEVYDPQLGEYRDLEEPLIDPDGDISWYAEARGRGVASVRAGTVAMYLDREHARRETSPKTGLARTSHRAALRATA